MSRTFSDRSRRVSNEDRPTRGRRREPSTEEVELFGVDPMDQDEKRDLDAIREVTSYLLDDVREDESIADAYTRRRA